MLAAISIYRLMAPIPNRRDARKLSVDLTKDF
jgi:hypothetical protein